MENRITFKEFLESIPPYREIEISDLNIFNGILEIRSGKISSNYPDIEIECPICRGKRFFSKTDYLSEFPNSDSSKTSGIVYTCKNCEEAQKIYTLKFIQLSEELKTRFIPGKIMKVGEYPPFGDSIPSKVISLVGKERDFFLKGRRCENQSLGIGAYAYY